MTNSRIYNLFVYGSLRSGFQSPVYEYISRFFTLVGEAKVKGNLFDMGSYPAGVPTFENNFIIGELYRTKQENEFPWAIGQLDDYEGVAVEPDEIQLYRREVVEVHINSDIDLAWIYWYNGNIDGKPLIASGDLMQYLEQMK